VKVGVEGCGILKLHNFGLFGQGVSRWIWWGLEGDMQGDPRCVEDSPMRASFVNNLHF
jgi:hypothetical protein